MLMRLVVDFDAPTATRTDPSVSVRRFHFHPPKKPEGRERVHTPKAGQSREPNPQWREVRCSGGNETVAEYQLNDQRRAISRPAIASGTPPIIVSLIHFARGENM